MWLKPLDFEVFFCKVVQKGRVIIDFIIDTVMPDPDPVSPAIIKEWRSRIKYGMTPILILKFAVRQLSTCLAKKEPSSVRKLLEAFFCTEVTLEGSRKSTGNASMSIIHCSWL